MELWINLDVLNMYLGLFPAALVLGTVVGLIHHALQKVA